MIEYQLPKDGHDGVFTDRAVIGAIIGGPNSAVAQAFADAGQVTNVTGRVLINNAATAHAQNLRDEAWFAWRHTAIDDGITLAKQDLHSTGLHTSRRGIDAAGDGTNNASRAAQDARDATVGPGITPRHRHRERYLLAAGAHPSARRARQPRPAQETRIS